MWIYDITLTCPAVRYSFFLLKWWSGLYLTGVALCFLCSGVFVGLGLSGVVPSLHFVISEGLIKATTMGQMGWLLLMATLYITGAGLYAARIPERFFPGKCDIWVSDERNRQDVLRLKNIYFLFCLASNLFSFSSFVVVPLPPAVPRLGGRRSFCPFSRRLQLAGVSVHGRRGLHWRWLHLTHFYWFHEGAVVAVCKELQELVLLWAERPTGGTIKTDNGFGLILSLSVCSARPLWANKTKTFKAVWFINQFLKNYFWFKTGTRFLHLLFSNSQIIVLTLKESRIVGNKTFWVFSVEAVFPERFHTWKEKKQSDRSVLLLVNLWKWIRRGMLSLF